MSMDKKTYLIEQTCRLTAIPSPTGMTRMATDYLLAELTRLGYKPERTPKGTVMCCIGGTGHPLVLSAHVDTLGAMVRAVKGNGCLRMTLIGGVIPNSIETENVLVHTRGGKTYTGTVQSIHASSHVWGDRTAEARGDETLEVVLDEKVFSRAETEALGISVGDFISFDPRTVVTPGGYIKSRHLDDKASSAVLLTLAREVAEGRVKLGRKTTLIFTVYEEIGHGASPVAKMDVEDMLAVDMGCVGDDLTCREHQVSICAKDSSGPFDYDFTGELIERAKRLGIDYAVDIYPRYSSDAATALRAGMEARFALCGQGVYASHGYERTHIDGMLGTLALVTDVAENR
ncbi:MAG: M42 family metallopeptidase [Clostridia bacterium]|nr:M42 family metallopeptidase [Clostridia bacterium]